MATEYKKKKLCKVWDCKGSTSDQIRNQIANKVISKNMRKFNTALMWWACIF